MNTQTDMFAAGETRSVPPHLDPAIVGAVRVRSQWDRDHVGVQDVGKYGNNREILVVEVWDKNGAVIWAEKCDKDQAAIDLANEIGRKLDANRQTDLFS